MDSVYWYALGMQLAVVEGIEKALNQNSLFWLVNGDAELERLDEANTNSTSGSGNQIPPSQMHLCADAATNLASVANGGVGNRTAHAMIPTSSSISLPPGSEMKDICLNTINKVVQSVTPAGADTSTPTPAPAALQLLQQFDVLEQQQMRVMGLRAVEELASTSRMGEEAALEEVKRAAEVGFLSDADNIVMQNAQADILDKLHARLRQLENKQRQLLGAVAEDFDARRRRVRHEVKYLLPHMRETERRYAGDADEHVGNNNNNINSIDNDDDEDHIEESISPTMKMLQGGGNNDREEKARRRAHSAGIPGAFKGPKFFTDDDRAILNIGSDNRAGESTHDRIDVLGRDAMVPAIGGRTFTTSSTERATTTTTAASARKEDEEKEKMPTPAWRASLPWIVLGGVVMSKGVHALDEATARQIKSYINSFMRNRLVATRELFRTHILFRTLRTIRATGRGIGGAGRVVGRGIGGTGRALVGTTGGASRVIGSRATWLAGSACASIKRTSPLRLIRRRQPKRRQQRNSKLPVETTTVTPSSRPVRGTRTPLSTAMPMPSRAATAKPSLSVEEYVVITTSS